MSELSDSCGGFYFRYFSVDSRGHRKKIQPDPSARAAEELILKRFNEILKNRPDLMEALACLEEGLEIRLYKGSGFEDYTDGIYFYGRATKDGDEVILEFAIDEILQGGRPDGDVMDIVVHEIAHILDYMDDHDGFLPGWSDGQRELFCRARDVERTKIRDGESPLVGYALTNDEEFLAVLTEVYFTRPDSLKRSNPALYELMVDFFHQDPASAA